MSRVRRARAATPRCLAQEVGTGVVLADRLRPALTSWTRLRGLLGTSPLAFGEGLWIVPCRQVHMFGMRYPIDVAFLDKDLRIVRTVSALQPGRVSPNVREATSVLELPAGRLEQLGVGAGARLAIEPDLRAQAIRTSGLAAGLTNLVLALLYVLFASVHISLGLKTGRWLVTVPIVAQETLLVLLFLTRRRSTVVSQRSSEWLVGVLGTFLPLLVRPTVDGGFAIGAGIQAAGLALAVVALSSLGRSIGIVPAHRGLTTAGMYRRVRHPMYVAHILAYLGYALSFPSARNLTIVVGMIVAVVLRAGYEENLLARDPDYLDYMRRVPWRFVPGLY